MKTKRAKCWHCKKLFSLKIISPNLRFSVLLPPVLSEQNLKAQILPYFSVNFGKNIFGEASLPNPLCKKCIESFRKWLLVEKGEKNEKV